MCPQMGPKGSREKSHSDSQLRASQVHLYPTKIQILVDPEMGF